MTTIEKVAIGALGGLAAVCVKFLGQDYHYVVTQASNLARDRVNDLIIGYSVLTPILVFLGGLLTWASDETKRLKLLAIAVSAPALITTWAGGSKPESSSNLGATL